MSKEGGRDCLYELCSGKERLLIDLVLSERDDDVAKTSEIEHRWQSKRGIQLWMDWWDIQRTECKKVWRKEAKPRPCSRGFNYEKVTSRV